MAERANRRSAQRTVRNPVMGLPAMAQLAGLPPEARDALRAVLGDIRADAARRAEASWRSNKGPMAAYWKAVSVYARHISVAVKEAAPTLPLAQGNIDHG